LEDKNYDSEFERMKSAKLHVLIIGPLPTMPNAFQGGVEAVVMNLSNALASNKRIKVSIVDFSSKLRTRSHSRLSANLDVYYYPLPYPDGRFLNFLLLGNSIIRNVLRDLKPDIIHLQGTIPYAYLIKNGNRKKTIVTIHGVYREEMKHQVNLVKKIKFGLKVFYEKLRIDRFKNFVFISDYNKAEFFKHVASKENIRDTRIFNPVDPIFFEQVPQQTKALSTELIFVAGLRKLKGLHLLLDAMAMLKSDGIECNLRVVGGFRENEYERMIEEKIKRLQLDRQVIFTGWEDKHQLRRLLIKSAVFVLPSFQESLPVSIAEAMAMGKVVIATKVGGIPEMIEDGVSGFMFERGNVVELYHKLKMVVQNPELIESISNKAREQAEILFHPQNIANQTIEFYHKVLGLNRHVEKANIHSVQEKV